MERITNELTEERFAIRNTMLTLFTRDVDSRIVMFRTKVPYYDRGTLPPPIRPPDFCMSGLCPKNQLHIACQPMFWGPQCEKPRFGINMEENQNIILELHNDLRLLVNSSNSYLPTATDMNKLQWDTNLGIVAMRVTNFCQKVDEYCLNVPSHLNVGKNDFISKGEMVIPKAAIILKHIILPFKALMFKEITADDVRSFPTNATDLQKTIAQMILSSAKRIGCGMLIRFKQPHFLTYLTCLYDNKVQPGLSIYSSR